MSGEERREKPRRVLFCDTTLVDARLGAFSNERRGESAVATPPPPCLHAPLPFHTHLVRDASPPTAVVTTHSGFLYSNPGGYFNIGILGEELF